MRQAKRGREGDNVIDLRVSFEDKGPFTDALFLRKQVCILVPTVTYLSGNVLCVLRQQ